jgi:hypothetical protein
MAGQNTNYYQGNPHGRPILDEEIILNDSNHGIN